MLSFYFNSINRKLTILLLGIVLLIQNSLKAQCNSSNPISNPEAFNWTYHPVSDNNPEAYYSGTIEVGQETFIFNGNTFTTRAYRQEGGNYSIPGPTIHLIPGNKYIMRFHNLLPYEPLSTSHNVFKDPNASNIHTHGLHISGESPGDDVERTFEGGTGGDFVWDIPADHMGGTYWYHAHHHGSSFLQVSGGLFGMIVVDDSQDNIPASVASMEEKELVIGFLDRGASGTGGDVLMGGTLNPTWTVNGKIGGDMCIPSGTWQHWRVLLADRDAMMKDLSFGPECEVMLLARDGVWRTMAPMDLASNMIGLTGASRADFAIRTNSNSWIKVDGAIVANITVGGTQNASPHPFASDGISMWSATRPSYLRDLRNEVNVHTETINMGARTINGTKYDHMMANITLPPNQVQQWSLSGATMHPFHLHVYHVQAQSTNGMFEEGEYYDVVSTNVPIRFDLNQNTSSVYAGRTIMHCHILGHEDRGAMGWMNVTGGISAPTYPSDGNLTSPYTEYYVLDAPPPPPPTLPAAPSSLNATSLSTSSIDLTWIDNSDNEDGFTIESSLDGLNFSFEANLSANTTSYSDQGLSPATTYYYRIYSYNAVGTSSYSQGSATTNPDNPGGSPAAHVEEIIVSRENLNAGRARGVASILVTDQFGNAIPNATVTCSYSGPNSGSTNSTTGSDGFAVLRTSPKKNPSGDWCFQVTNVSVTGMTYNSNDNTVNVGCEGGYSAKNLIETESINSDLLLGIFPNPFDNIATIEFVLNSDANVEIKLFDLLGAEVLDVSIGYCKAGKNSYTWNVPTLSNGPYILKFITPNFNEIRRVMISK
jgi:FtsP/CotA-like multicopper oxidase with cupredoxin domain